MLVFAWLNWSTVLFPMWHTPRGPMTAVLPAPLRLAVEHFDVPGMSLFSDVTFFSQIGLESKAWKFMHYISDV